MNPLRSLRSESLSHCEGVGTGAELTGVRGYGFKFCCFEQRGWRDGG